MLTQCEWTSGIAIPQLRQDATGIAEARQLIQQLTLLAASKREANIPAKQRQTTLQIEGQACGTQGDMDPSPLLVETAELLSRCEKDLGATRAAVARELKSAREYKEGIDKLRKRRLMEMGGEVQREHETCLANILELQWHVSHTERKLKVLRDNVRMKKRQHSLLKESEDHMTEHSPLVRKKGNTEKLVASSIQSDLESTEGEIRGREEVRGEKRGVWEREQLHADRARAQMLGERRKLEEELEQAVKELREAEEEGKSLGEEMEESVRKRERNQRECKELHKQEEECISSTESLAKSIKNMELHLQSLKQQLSVHKQRHEESERQLEGEIAAVEREETELKESVRSSNIRLHEVRDENETLIQDIDTLKQNRERCKKETKDNSNTIGRIQKQMVTLERQVSVAEEEASAMREVHQDMMLKVRELENNVQQEETEIKKEKERLDKGLKEENHVLTVTQVKVQVEEKSLEKLSEQLQSKRETIGRVLSETESSRDTQRTEVEEIQSRYAQIRNGITDTDKQLGQLKDRRESHVREVTSAKSVRIPERDGLESKLSEMKEDRDKTETDIKYSRHKLDDVTASSSMMEGMIGKLGEEVETMGSEQEEVQQVLDKEREERAVLENEKEELKAFVRNLRENHGIFVQDKRADTEKAQEDLSEVIRRNAALTGEYRSQQNSHMSARTKLLQWTDEKLKLVSSLKDHKQLMGIQARMHSAAQEYYRQRGTRAQHQLARLVREGEGNKDKSVGMKQLLENVMSEIRAFLELYARMSALRGVKKARVKFSDVIEFEPDTRNVSRSTLPPIQGNKH